MSVDEIRAAEIFERASEIEDLEDRRAFVREACREDQALLVRINELLSAHSHATELSFLSNARRQGTSQDFPISPLDPEQVGAVIDRYKLLQKIGEGGMGVVFMADQVAPVKRQVALKIIKIGMDTEQVVARFEAERQALALMDHPNIAKVLDGGATESGRPYFVMELVKGTNITEFCARARLGVTERIRLFLQVCDAIQSAHQKGIIHRDIKPSNILITLHHGDPFVKVIDFGIAKATNQRLTEKTLFTKYAQMIGTPAYMSPEQAEMSSMDIDTRSDVYSLGVLLYELLTETTPFPEKQLLSLGYAEMQRVIAEEEPDKPSTRITNTQSAVTVPGNRERQATRGGSSAPQLIVERIRGDLDWITMKCLEKDRRRRYATPSELASDLGRHLKNEPVMAAAPTLSYQMTKAYQRHKTAVRISVAFAVFLLLSAIVAGAMAIRMGYLKSEADKLRVSESEFRMKAEGERDRAIEAESGLRQVTEEVEDQLYAADMIAVSEAIANEEWKMANEILERHQNEASGRDLRGFEWHYFTNLAEGDQMAAFQAHQFGIGRMSVSAGGRWLATAGQNGVVKLWDLETHELHYTWEDLGRELVSLSFSADQRYLSCGILPMDFRNDLPGLDVFDMDSMERVWSPEGAWLGGQFSPEAGVMALVDSARFPARQFQLWDVNSGSPAVPELKGLGSEVVFSPSGRYLAASRGRGRAVDVWDVGKREIVNTIEGASYSGALAISKDEQYLLAGKRNRRNVGVWNIRSGESLMTFTNHVANVTAGFFHPDSSEQVITGSTDRSIQCWDWRSGEVLWRKTGQSSGITCLDIDPVHSRLVSGAEDGSVMFWSLENQRAKDRIPTVVTVHRPVLSNSGRYLVAHEWIAEWSFRERGLIVDPIGQPPAPVEEGDAKPPVPRIAIRLMRLAEGAELPETGELGTVIGRRPDGSIEYRRFGFGGQAFNTKRESELTRRQYELGVLKKELETLWDMPELSFTKQVEIRALLKDLGRFVVWQESVYDAQTTGRLWALPDHQRTLGFTEDERELISVSRQQVIYRRIETGEAVRTVTLQEPILSPNFTARTGTRWFDLSADAELMAVSGPDPAIRIIRLADGITSARLEAPLFLSDICYAAGGRLVAFNGHRGIEPILGYWEIETNNVEILPLPEGAMTNQFEVSLDGRLLAASCTDDTIRIWNLETRELEHSIAGFREYLGAPSFSPDSRTMAIIRSNDPRTFLWNTRTWRQIATLTSNSKMHGVHFSPSGEFLLTSDWDGARFWRAKRRPAGNGHE